MTLACAHLGAGAELHYLDRGAGPDVVLLHGGMADCQSWLPQVQALEQRFRVISFSRRHHSPNRNPAPGDTFGLADDVQDLAALLDTLGMRAPHLVGTSYGALVALAFALERPTAVASLVLCEPPLHAWACDTVAGRALLRRFLAQAWNPARVAFDDGDPLRALRLLTDAMSGAPVFERLPPQRVASALRNAPAMAALTRSRNPFAALPRAQVAALAMPVLLLRGEGTSGLHACVMDALGATLPGATVVVIPGARHAPASDNAPAFNAALLEFLQRACSTAATPVGASSQTAPSAATRG
jgi:pimeloyl-ACP methyl ester carboxylesterase